MPLQHEPDRHPGTRQLQEPPCGASVEADATRERAPAGLIALPARALPAPSSRVQQPRARACACCPCAPGAARAALPSRWRCSSSWYSTIASAAAPPASAPRRARAWTRAACHRERHIDMVQQRGLHALQLRARGTARTPRSPQAHERQHAHVRQVRDRPRPCRITWWLLSNRGRRQGMHARTVTLRECRLE